MSSHMTSPLPHSIGNFLRRQRLGFSFSDSRLGATRRFERLAPRATWRLCQPWPWLGASRIRCPAVSGTEPRAGRAGLRWGSGNHQFARSDPTRRERPPPTNLPLRPPPPRAGVASGGWTARLRRRAGGGNGAWRHLAHGDQDSSSGQAFGEGWNQA